MGFRRWHSLIKLSINLRLYNAVFFKPSLLKTSTISSRRGWNILGWRASCVIISDMRSEVVWMAALDRLILSTKVFSVACSDEKKQMERVLT